MPHTDEDALLIFEKFLARREAEGSTSLDELLDEHPSIHDRLIQLAREHDVMFAHVSRSGPVSDTNAVRVPPSEVFQRLARRSSCAERYSSLGELGRGGMGTVLRVRDKDLNRYLAMKVVLDQTSRADTSDADQGTLARFLDEAQITGQLDHPGIVPVHELGLDSDGRAYFTMKLVRGEDFSAIIKRVHGTDESWTLTRALNAMLKVCEALSYAHAKGVIHRDLKPANIMVGRFEEVHVMDWGLARVLGQDDMRDLRIIEAAQTESIETLRRNAREEQPDTPLVTMDGTVVGTPAYMPPEQANGELEILDQRADVYALGAVLYHLLTGQMPFVPKDARVSPRTILMRVLEGPPKPIQDLAQVPAELQAIAEKAMARPRLDRYATVGDLAADLRAYLDLRAVAAHRTGAITELRKWIIRNRGQATGLLTALITLIVGVSVAWTLHGHSEYHRARAEEAEEAAAWRMYVASVTDAQMAIKNSDFARAHFLLDGCDPSLRDWEWNHLRLRCDLTTETCPDYRSCAFSPDATKLAVATHDDQIIVLDAATRSELGRVKSEHHSLSMLEFTYDGNFIVSSSSTAGPIQVWNASRLLSRRVISESSHYQSIAVSPNAPYVAGASISSKSEAPIRVWDINSGAPVWSALLPIYSRCVAFSPNGKLIAAGFDDGTVRVWNISRELVWNTSHDLSPEETAPIPVTILGSAERSYFGSEIGALAFSPDGRWLVTGTADGFLTKWSTETLNSDHRPPIKSRASSTPITSIDFHPHGGTFVASTGRSMQLWDTNSFDRILETPHTSEIKRVSFSPGGETIATASSELAFWDADTCSATRLHHQVRLPDDCYGEAGSDHLVLAFSPGGHRLVSAHSCGLALWSPMDPLSFDYIDHTDAKDIQMICFGADDNILYSYSLDGRLRRWNLTSGALEATSESSLESGQNIVSLTYNVSSCRLVTADESGLIGLWNDDGLRLDTSIRALDSINGLATAPDLPLLAASSDDGHICLIDLTTGDRQVSLVGGGPIENIAFAGSDRLVGVESGVLTSWSLRTHEPIAWQPNPFATKIASVAATRAGQRIATTHEDASIVIWDSSRLDPLLQLHQARTDQSPVWLGNINLAGLEFDEPSITDYDFEPVWYPNAVFGPDGRRLAVLHPDGYLTIYESEFGDAQLAWPQQLTELRIRNAVETLSVERPSLSQLLQAIESLSDIGSTAMILAIDQVTSCAHLAAEELRRTAWANVDPDSSSTRTDGKSALAHARRAAGLNPDDPTIRNTLAWALLASGRTAEALAQSEMAMALSSPEQLRDMYDYYKRIRRNLVSEVSESE